MKKLLDVSVRKGERINFEEWKSSLIKVEECDHLTRCWNAAEDTERYEGNAVVQWTGSKDAQRSSLSYCLSFWYASEMGGEG
jgi:lipid-A-disaccharide synthase-like uncharacterized protein